MVWIFYLYLKQFGWLVGSWFEIIGCERTSVISNANAPVASGRRFGRQRAMVRGARGHVAYSKRRLRKLHIRLFCKFLRTYWHFEGPTFFVFLAFYSLKSGQHHFCRTTVFKCNLNYTGESSSEFFSKKKVKVKNIYGT